MQSHTNNKPQILRLTIRKIFIYRKAVTPHVYTNIKNVLSFREARNLGVKILTARHSDSEQYNPPNRVVRFGLNVLLDETETCGRFGLNDRTIPAHLPDTFRGSSESLRAFKKTFRCFRQNASAFYLKRFGVFSNENCPAPTFLFRLLQGRLITSKSRYL